MSVSLSDLAAIGLRPAVFYFSGRLIADGVRRGVASPVGAAQATLVRHRCQLTDQQMAYVRQHFAGNTGQLTLPGVAA